MPELQGYRQFRSTHWVTGSIHNALAYAGYTAPHTDEAYSEALLLGISGGIAFGYFYFHYDHHYPQVNLLTRNTFNNYGFDAIVELLGIIQHVQHATSESRARTNLVEALANGEAPIVWADLFSFPYAQSEFGDDMYAMMPIVVYEYDAEQNTAHFADRAMVGIPTSASTLDAARARVKKDRYRLITLESPNPDKLPAAVSKGIWDCIKLFTEKPPRGSAHNFGFKAYQRWSTLLTKATAKGSWAKVLPTGRDLYAGLTTAYTYGWLFGKDDSKSGERFLYADFLAEAALILEKPHLTDVAAQFRAAGEQWQALGCAILPDDVPLLKESRDLLDTREKLYRQHGVGKLAEIHAMDHRLAALHEASADFPLNHEGIRELQTTIAAHVQRIHDAEQSAVAALQHAMS